jgi:hypothetical protein
MRWESRKKNCDSGLADASFCRLAQGFGSRETFKEVHAQFFFPRASARKHPAKCRQGARTLGFQTG